MQRSMSLEYEPSSQPYHISAKHSFLNRDFPLNGSSPRDPQGFKHLETAYVAGLSVITSVLDLLLCQQYFNPHMMALMYEHYHTNALYYTNEFTSQMKCTMLYSYKYFTSTNALLLQMFYFF